MPPWLRRLLWTAVFIALAARVAKGLKELDEPLPEEVPAEWPPLQFESSPPSASPNAVDS